MTALYEVVRDNLETLYEAIGDGALAVRIPKHARKELKAYLGCGLLCRCFARLKCEDCGKRRLLAFRCRGRGFCPSCTGRRMNATAANLIERVLPPESRLRQWVLTFPFSWRRRLAQDGALLGRLTRMVVETVRGNASLHVSGAGDRRSMFSVAISTSGARASTTWGAPTAIGGCRFISSTSRPAPGACSAA